MIHVIDTLTPDERSACEASGRAALDAVLARLSEADRTAIWHSIRCGYVQPTTGQDAASAAPDGPARPFPPVS